MANESENSVSVMAPLRGMSYLPLVRQLGVLIGLAASVALGVAVVMWSQTPSYRVLYGNLADRDQTQVAEGLQQANIPYKIDIATGSVMVPEKHVHDARLKLASQGLPRGANGGFEIMESKSNFGTSQFVETARYQHALEGELARSVMAINHVQTARVHLALPKQSVFIRNRQRPSASVVVNLFQGRNLDDGQVAAVVHLVASSIPNLDAERVTVVDQRGRLLTGRENLSGLALSASHFEHARRLEDAYTKRIETLLTPIIGPGGVRAQVAVDLDFTVTEKTQESFNPDAAVVRSEQIAEERSSVGTGAAGIPGALSNQPPGGASVPETTAASASAGTASGQTEAVKPAALAAAPTNSSRRSVRNFEIDRTISHTRGAPGRIKRISVAVVLDDKQVLDEDDEVVRESLTPEELTTLTALVKDTVGFNAERGDSIQVTNTPFATPPEPEPLPEPALLDNPLVWDIGKQVLAGIVVLLLIFVVLRPMLHGLATRPIPVELTAASALPGNAGAPALPAGTSNYETSLNDAKSIAQQDPKRAAQVVKNWVTSDA